MSEICFQMLPNEYWWGGVVNLGDIMPVANGDDKVIDPCGGDDLDQCAPFFVSSKGRYVWSESAFSFKAYHEEIYCKGIADICLEEGYVNLRQAYLAASKKLFPFTGALPDMRFFTMPQYNTWIQLQTNQTQDAILSYAEEILQHGLCPGILMIDEGWQEEYGVFECNKRKIPDMKLLVKKLHAMGFIVMLWVTPIVACAGAQYKMLKKKGFLLKDKTGEPAVRKWWNGYSALIDLTCDKACQWLKNELDGLRSRYGIDGFKFDAGDRYFYSDSDQTHYPISARDHTALYNRLGEEYTLNEFRAAWKCGGRAVVARLQDKNHLWGRGGLGSLIPNTIVQGLTGYAYGCPDMVGGGDIGSFDEGQELDEELFVRWAQASACLGMMQMSILPWRALSAENAELVVKAFKFHESLSERLCKLAKQAAETGEPIVRHMAYVFPNEDFETVNDQFLLGDDMLVCPVHEKGALQRKVKLPKGRWRSWRGDIVDGGRSITFDVGLNDIPILYRA